MMSIVPIGAYHGTKVSRFFLRGVVVGENALSWNMLQGKIHFDRAGRFGSTTVIRIGLGGGGSSRCCGDARGWYTIL